MTTISNRLAALAFGLAVAAAASPSLAQRNDYNDNHVSAARAAALRECTNLEQKYSEYTWGVTEIQQYRACMAARGQPE